jgi:hypothetical protein
MTIQARVSTVLKTKLKDSKNLASHEKRTIQKGQALQVSRVTPALNDHLLIELINHEFDRAYIYVHHWNFEQEIISLDVSYYYQGDNPGGYGYRECNATCNAMLLNKLRNGWLDAEAIKRGFKQPESIYLAELDRHGDTTNHDANTATLRQFGIESFWSTSLTLEDFYIAIRNDIPLVMGFDYKGPDQGHIVLGKGFNLLAGIIEIHDPNGARLGASDEWISNLPEAGKNDRCSIATFERLWFPRGSLGWGRIPTHVNGVPTVFADS